MREGADDGKTDRDAQITVAPVSRAGSWFLHELESSRVDAVTQTCRLRAVVEDVTEVSVAAFAEKFGARHAKGEIGLGFDVLFGNGWKKLGQPVPDSNFASDLNSAVPQQTQRYEPSSWLFQ